MGKTEDGESNQITTDGKEQKVKIQVCSQIKLEISIISETYMKSV